MEHFGPQIVVAVERDLECTALVGNSRCRLAVRPRNCIPHSRFSCQVGIDSWVGIPRYSLLAEGNVECT